MPGSTAAPLGPGATLINAARRSSAIVRGECGGHILLHTARGRRRPPRAALERWIAAGQVVARPRFYLEHDHDPTEDHDSIRARPDRAVME